MIEVEVSKIKNEEKLHMLMEFLCSMSTEICFTAPHTYHIDEETTIEALNEYKKRCKDKHRELEKYYSQNEPILINALVKIKVKTREQFDEYKDNLYMNEMQLCKKMDSVFEELMKNETQRDYIVAFPEIRNSYKGMEVHMFDSVGTSIIPLDCVIYNASNEIKNLLMKMRTPFVPFLSNKEEKVMLINPLFCKDDDAFGVINTEQGTINFVLDENQYKEFKKLKIKHKKDVSKDE